MRSIINKREGLLKRFNNLSASLMIINGLLKIFEGLLDRL